uniref:G_PROTEIN_RECEP_F1_2 domain-containing protein n=1 Tax=Elaeophora elaphi TaxID=1147741 RepID=A0A0R3S3I7_9BILA
MKLCLFIVIEEKYSFICGLPLKNRRLCVIFASLQFFVALTSLLQHAYSIREHNTIFACHSNITTKSSPSEMFLAYDIIIFDYGLMHRVLGTNECIANYLDGGFMRSFWCLSHTGSLFLLIIALFFLNKPIWLLWPALLMQSSYALGLAVLTMATAPKMLDALSGKVDTEFGTAFTVYLIGFISNWLFTFILWHHYWYIEEKLKVISSKHILTGYNWKN